MKRGGKKRREGGEGADGRGGEDTEREGMGREGRRREKREGKRKKMDRPRFRKFLDDDVDVPVDEFH